MVNINQAFYESRQLLADAVIDLQRHAALSGEPSTIHLVTTLNQFLQRTQPQYELPTCPHCGRESMLEGAYVTWGSGSRLKLHPDTCLACGKTQGDDDGIS